MAYHLKLIQPKELPADNLTSAEFKPWTNHLVNFLQKDVENFRFLTGGKYSTWSPASDSASNQRITGLDETDPDSVAIEGHDTNTRDCRRVGSRSVFVRVVYVKHTHLVGEKTRGLLKPRKRGLGDILMFMWIIGILDTITHSRDENRDSNVFS